MIQNRKRFLARIFLASIILPLLLGSGFFLGRTFTQWEATNWNIAGKTGFIKTENGPATRREIIVGMRYELLAEISVAMEDHGWWLRFAPDEQAYLETSRKWISEEIKRAEKMREEKE